MMQYRPILGVTWETPAAVAPRSSSKPGQIRKSVVGRASSFSVTYPDGASDRARRRGRFRAACGRCLTGALWR